MRFKLCIASISTIVISVGMLSYAVAQTPPYVYEDGTEAMSKGIIEIGNAKFDSLDLEKIYAEVNDGKTLLKTTIEDNNGTVTATGENGVLFEDLANGVDSVSDGIAEQITPVLKYIPNTNTITIKDTTYTGEGLMVSSYSKSDQPFTWDDEKGRYTTEITVNNSSTYFHILAPGVKLSVNIMPSSVDAIKSSVWESIQTAADGTTLPTDFATVNNVESLSAAITAYCENERNAGYSQGYTDGSATTGVTINRHYHTNSCYEDGFKYTFSCPSCGNGFYSNNPRDGEAGGCGACGGYQSGGFSCYNHRIICGYSDGEVQSIYQGSTCLYSK